MLVVVLLVPEMFRGRPAESASPSTSIGEGERIYSLPVGPAGGSSPMVANPTGATDAPAAVDNPATGAATAVNPTPAALLQPASSQPAGAQPTAVQPAAVQPAAVQQAVPAHVETSKPSAATPAAAMAAAPAATRKTPQAGEWVVQVGSFAHADLAKQMVRQVRAKGFTVEAVGPDDKGLYRVRSSPFREREAALGLKARMVDKGLKPIVTGVH